uniref:Sulfhydryl oxidase n=1 Tax=Trichobilharzia regenti TaxID=157069 RepID=A0AA85K0U9_TRIRE|nr:unnamed protein product [Trichobilharzia regenti]
MLPVILVLYIILKNVASIPYDEIKDVASLNPEIFDERTSNGTWLIIFYRKSCGHCINYSETFLKLSNSVKNWKWVLNLGSVDCENENNTVLCRRFEIYMVPTLQFLSSKEGGYLSEKISAQLEIDDIRFIIASKLLNISTLQLTRELAVNDPLTVTSNSAVTNALIILDYSLPLKRSFTSITEEEATDIEITSFLSKSVVVKGTEEEVRKVLDGMSDISPSLEEISKPDVIKMNEFPTKYLPVYGVDIYRSLSMLLQSDVSALDVIQGTSLAALKQFLQMLHELLPASEEYKEYLSNVSTWLNTKTSITGQEWSAFLKEINFPLYKGPFIGCRGSKPHFRGYPCGLWTLFHALTVQQYLLSTSKSEPQVDSVAHALNRFVPRFFSCTYCAFHFALNTANIVKPGESILPEDRPSPSPEQFIFDETIIPTLPKAPITPRDSVLWLSFVHNRVNKRLAGQLSEDPTAPKIQFPSFDICPNCWAPNSKGELQLGKNPQTEEAYFQFLVERYGKSSWNYDQLPVMFITDDLLSKVLHLRKHQKFKCR